MIPALGLAVASCATAVTPSPPPPTAPPTASPTPDPHLSEPTTADEVFRSLQIGGLRVLANNAVSGGQGEPLVKRINATFENWPLIVAEYRTAIVLRGAIAWDPARPADPADPPYSFVGLNILVEYGPSPPSGGTAAPPEARFRDAAQRLADVLHRLIGPLEQRAIEPLPIPTPLGIPSVPPSVGPDATETASPSPPPPAG